MKISGRTNDNAEHGHREIESIASKLTLGHLSLHTVSSGPLKLLVIDLILNKGTVYYKGYKINTSNKVTHRSVHKSCAKTHARTKRACRAITVKYRSKEHHSSLFNQVNL